LGNVAPPFAAYGRQEGEGRFREDQMKHQFFCCVFALSLTAVVASVFAHEKTGWVAPEEARKMKNPINAAKESIQKGREIYEKKCALCHGDKGDGKGPASAGLSPKPTNFKESHGEKMTDGEHFWKITTGRRGMPSFTNDLTEEERWHVINYINTFSRHP
jgi:mono/diheme cytochrome c family protein